MEVKETRWIDSIDLNSIIEEIMSLKGKEFSFPKEERVFTQEAKSVSFALKKMKFPFDKKYYVEKVNKKNKEERVKDALDLLSLLYVGREEELRKKIYPFFYRVKVEESDSLHLHQTALIYKSGTKPKIESISVAKEESALQSISLARTVAGAIKNENREEFYNIWKYDYTIPFFLEEFFAQKMSKEKGNEDLLKLVRFLRMWTVQVQNKYYREMHNIWQNEKISVDSYKARMYVTLEAYPVIKGYIDALKLLKVAEEKGGNWTPILKEIRNVLGHTKTTAQIVRELKINDIDSRQVVKERCALVKKQYK